MNFFLRILVERNFCFHMGISQSGVVGDFPFVFVSLRYFPFILLSLGISHLFSYLWLFPICYWLLGNRFELLETNLPLTHSPIKVLQGKVRLGLCFDCSYNESSHPSTGCRLVPLHPKWKSHRLLCVRPVPRNPRLDYPLWG